MKNHHAATSLVIWHLMIPAASPAAVLVAAPLSEWNNAASYDSAENCESVLTMLKEDSFTQAQYDCLPDRSRENLCYADIAMTSSECVSTDDPRLREE
jgi:hypothetical protein